MTQQVAEAVQSEETEWDSREAVYVTQLRETKIEPVPAPIVALAQKSYDGAPDPDHEGQKLHAMQLTFETVARAIAFERHMRNAGPHTTPPSSVTVVRDPNRKKVAQTGPDGNVVMGENGKPVMVPGPAVNPNLVAWRAGIRRGRKS